MVMGFSIGAIPGLAFLSEYFTAELLHLQMLRVDCMHADSDCYYCRFEARASPLAQSWERLGSLIPACEKQVCLTDLSVRVLWPSSGRRWRWRWEDEMAKMKMAKMRSSPWRRSEYSDRNVGKTNLSFTRWNQRTQHFYWRFPCLDPFHAEDINYAIYPLHRGDQRQWDNIKNCTGNFEQNHSSESDGRDSNWSSLKTD